MGKVNEKLPHWWTTQDTGAWERVREAFARDWEQTKADFTSTDGQDLDQNVGDTVKQAVGKEDIPARGMPNQKMARPDRSKKAKPEMHKHKPKDEVPGHDYGRAEPALRYGFGASRHFEGTWDPKVESELHREWDELYPGRDWDEDKRDVRSGWERGRTSK